MSEPQLQYRIRLVHGGEIAIGPGKADLLEAIADTGSISAAARKMNMSYRRGWLLVETMNTCFATPLVETSTGGTRGGGARLTDTGTQVLALYRTMQKTAATSTQAEIAALKKLLIAKPE